MTASHIWWVILLEPRDWFPQFGHRFSDPRFEVVLIGWEEGGASRSAWGLATERLDRCSKVEIARRIAYAETRVLSGLARLFWNGIPPVAPESVISLRNGRFIEGAVMTVPQAAVLVGRSGVEESLLDSSDPKSPVRADVIDRLADPALARALEVYGREQPNWGSLYKVFELARKEFGDDELVAIAEISKRTLSRFHATANLPDLGGLDARHAVQAGDSPEPITISQARVIARRLLANWLARHE